MLKSLVVSMKQQYLCQELNRGGYIRRFETPRPIPLKGAGEPEHCMTLVKERSRIAGKGNVSYAGMYDDWLDHGEGDIRCPHRIRNAGFISGAVCPRAN